MDSALAAMLKKSLLVAFIAFVITIHFQAEALTVKKKLTGKVMTQEVVNLPAADVWAVYSSPDLPALSVKIQPERFESIEVLEGDGHVGTVIRITLKPGFPGPKVLTDKFTKVDHKTRTKVLTQIRDGYLDLGFTKYVITYHITEINPSCCAIRSTTEFTVKEGSEMNATSITPNWKMADSIVKYIVDTKYSK